MDTTSKIRMAHDLRLSIRALNERGLIVASKWASELLNSLPADIRSAPLLPFSPPPQMTDSSHFSPSQKQRPSIGEFLPSPGPGAFSLSGDTSIDIPTGVNINLAGPSHHPDALTEDQILEDDRFQLARGYFDLKEFDRVAFVLKTSTLPKARFLRLYSQYLSADRKAQESLPHFIDLKEERLALYPAINPLIVELADEQDPYLVYLKGLLYMRIDQRSAAVECLIRAVTEQPYNWSAWSQLAQLIKSPEMYVDVKERLQPSIMLNFCAITVMLDLHTATDSVLATINELLTIFPHSIHLRAQKALVFYHMRDFESAESHFDAVQKLDPYRMEEVDIFSNMLYVMDKRAKLGKIAHEYAEIDRNRAEVCCLIGNYYSSRGDHTKAILYFKRALLLNRDYLPAWTLMGHEFVELKNSHAAIEAYRKAIDVNAKDYRAWYGLGQAYELLDMPMYAIEYYCQATSLRPYDCRMWTALATVYEAQSNLPEAIRAHERALLGADRSQTVMILAKLATLLTAIGEAQGGYAALAKETSETNSAKIGGLPPAIASLERAAHWHRRLVALGEQDGAGVPELAASYIALAEWEMRFIKGGSGSGVGSGGGKMAGGGGVGGGVGKKGKGMRREEHMGYNNEEEMDEADGNGADGADLALAARYLERVAQSNVPQRDTAEVLLRDLRVAEAGMVVGVGRRG